MCAAGGFHFPEFSAPYLSESMTEFWSRLAYSYREARELRLHFRYGGNVRGPWTYRNLMLTMLSAGDVAGAQWNFVIGAAIRDHFCARRARVGGSQEGGARARTFLFGWLRTLLTSGWCAVAWVFYGKTHWVDSLLHSEANVHVRNNGVFIMEKRHIVVLEVAWAGPGRGKRHLLEQDGSAPAWAARGWSGPGAGPR